MKKILILILFVEFFFTASAHAEVVGVAVNQGVFSFDLDPGSSKEFQVEIENTSKDSEAVMFEGQDVMIGDNNVLLGSTAVNELSGMRDWLTISQKNNILEPNGKVSIAVILSVPKDATVGSHYTMLNVNASPQITGENFQSTLVGGKIGIYVLVNVRGTASGQGELRAFQTPVITNTDATIKAEFENTGNIHYIPHGEIHIQNIFTRSKEDLETEKHFVFPGKKYAFELNWKPNSLFGMYKAEAFFVDGDGALHIARRFMVGRLFFIIPVLLFIFAFVLWRYYKKRHV